MCENFEKDNITLLAAKLERGFSKSEAAHAGGTYICYTDGSCDNLDRRRVGGASYIIIHNGEVFKKMSKSFVGTTNNRMELLAIGSRKNRGVPTGQRYDRHEAAGDESFAAPSCTSERYLGCCCHRRVRFPNRTRF